MMLWYLFITLLPIFMAMADPQTYLVTRTCGKAAATNPPSYYTTLNATFPILRSDLSSSLYASTHIPTSYQPIHVLVQCRDYLSFADCLACFDAAVSLIAVCYPSSKSYVVYDGCSLGYQSRRQSYKWEAKSVAPLQTQCEDRQANEAAAFRSTAETAVDGLVREVPSRKSLFGATKIEGGNGSVQVYAVAQCLMSGGIIEPVDCRRCLQSASQNVKYSCMPGAGGRSVMMECFLRYSDRPFFNESKVSLLEYRTHATQDDNKRPKLIIGGALCAAVVGLALLIAFVYVRHRREIRRTIKDTGRLIGSGLTELRQPVCFHCRDLYHATENFNEKYKLGQGGFASVYKGVIPGGRVVAVKKLTIGEAAETREGFEREIVLLSNTRHRNLVSLLGYCQKGSDLLLVYEYMGKGSLDKILFSDTSSETLSWRQRFDIVVGIARGLTYLHEDFCVPIIHRDIKCGNILLDDQLQAKIGDFGLARLFPEDQSHIRSRLAGTLGYTAPEYMLRGHLSEKVDIYSFGILVLEIVSRRRCNDMSIQPYLLEQAWRLYECNSLLDLVDKTMELAKSEDEEMKRVIQVGLMCTQSSYLRPTMSEVVARIMSETDVEFDLLRPTFMTTTSHHRTGNDHFPPAASANAGTNANMTISHFSAR